MVSDFTYVTACLSIGAAIGAASIPWQPRFAPKMGAASWVFTWAFFWPYLIFFALLSGLAAYRQAWWRYRDRSANHINSKRGME